MTLWDGGGTDTYDFSNYNTGVVDQPAARALEHAISRQIAITRTADRYAPGNVANALLHNGDTADR